MTPGKITLGLLGSVLIAVLPFSAHAADVNERSAVIMSVGLWGTSFSGGLVVYVAARDPRVRALVSQVGYMGQSVASTPASALEKSYNDATRRARGELGYPPPGVREIGHLTGAPIREKFLLYAPVDDVARLRNCAMLFIAAEREELFDNRQHPLLAYERATDPKKYVVIPNIAHYGI